MHTWACVWNLSEIVSSPINKSSWQYLIVISFFSDCRAQSDSSARQPSACVSTITSSSGHKSPFPGFSQLLWSPFMKRTWTSFPKSTLRQNMHQIKKHLLESESSRYFILPFIMIPIALNWYVLNNKLVTIKWTQTTQLIYQHGNVAFFRSNNLQGREKKCCILGVMWV